MHRSRVKSSLYKRGIKEDSSTNHQVWKRTITPSKGKYETSNLLGHGTGLTNQVTNIIIIEINNIILDKPMSFSFRIKSKDELIFAISDKLNLNYKPIIYYYNDLENEDIEVTDITILPNPTKIRIKKANDDENFKELFDVLKLKVPVKDRRNRFKTYLNCFVASELIDCIINENLIGVGTSRDIATQFCDMLCNAGLIENLNDTKKPFRDKQNMFYRFIDHHHQTTEDDEYFEKIILNEFSLVPYFWGNGNDIPYILQFKNTIVSIACGSKHSIALDVKGNIFSWGYGDNGQLGLGDKILYVEKPTLY